MVYKFKNSEPRCINFENPNGEKGKGLLKITEPKDMHLNLSIQEKKRFYVISKVVE